MKLTELEKDLFRVVGIFISFNIITLWALINML
jgi:hypothetical protein